MCAALKVLKKKQREIEMENSDRLFVGEESVAWGTVRV